MNKRILLISSNSSGRGGGERYLVYLTHGLRQLDCDVHALLSSANYMDNWASLLSIEGAQVHRKHLLGLKDRPLRFVQSMMDKNQQFKITQACKEIAPDAILVNQQYDEDGLDYLTGALTSKIPFVGGHMHMPMTKDKHKRPLGKLREKLLNQWYKNNPYLLILNNKNSQKEFENYYKAPRPTFAVHHGCVFPSVAKEPPPEPTHWSKDIPVIGFTGQFVYWKNLKLLIEAWLLIRRRGVEAKLLLVGDGPERKSLELLLKERAPKQSWFITGWQNNPEAYFSTIDVFTMSSLFEGLPFAFIEAVGMGLPSVVTNFNGAADVAEYAPWVNIVSDASVESFADALIATIANLSWLRQEAQKGQKAFRDYFSTQRMARETLNILGAYKS